MATTITDLVETAAQMRGDLEALVTDSVRWTYRDLIDRVGRAHGHLADAGLGAGSTVLVVLGNDEHHVVAALAAARAGIAVVPVDPRVTAAELGPIVELTEPDGIIVDRAVVRADVASRCDDVGITVIDAGPWWDGSEAPGPATVGANDPAAFFATSGTTGHARLIVHSHASLLRSIEALAAAPQSAEGQQRWLTPLPLHTIGGTTIVYRVLAQGDCLVLHGRFHPRRLVESIETERITCVGLAPTILATLFRVPDLDRYDFGSLGIVGVGAAALAPALVNRAEQTFGALVVNSYGSTELGGPVLLTTGAEARFDPLPDVEIRIVDAEGEAVADGAAGELSCRVNAFAIGELGRSGVVDLRDDEGWYRTGDAARRSDDDRIELLGRTDEQFSHDGFQVSPVEVEQVLLAHDQVVHAAVRGVSHPTGEGTVVEAHVVLAEGSTATAADLAAHCRDRLSPHKRPNRIVIADRLPLTASGKVKKHLLSAGEAT